MNTKEAIEILKKVIICDQDDYAMIELDTLEASEIIDVLKRGEKYEKILKELNDRYGSILKCYPIQNERFCTGNEIVLYLSEIIKELEQKYFPKE